MNKDTFDGNLKKIKNYLMIFFFPIVLGLILNVLLWMSCWFLTGREFSLPGRLLFVFAVAGRLLLVFAEAGRLLFEFAVAGRFLFEFAVAGRLL